MTALVQRTLDDVAWTPPEPDDGDARAVLACLLDGRRHSREDLVRQTSLNDRTVRAAYTQLRQLGWPVCASNDQRGVVLSWAAEDLDRLEHDLRSRSLATLGTLRAIRRARQRRVT